MSDPVRQALARLVQLKDGPRDDNYRATKDAAWQAAREALAGSTKCHRCGGLNGPENTYTRLDGTTYCLRDCEGLL
jgi:hypothetical protein